MRIRTIHIILAFSFLAFGQLAAQTLGDYLQTAAENNPGLKAKYLEYQAALEKVPQLGALPNPELSFGYFISPVETRVGAQRLNISAKQMFPWVGTLGARKDVATAMAKAKFEQFEAAREELFFKVRTSYFKIYEVEKSIEISREHQQILKSYEEISVQKFESGTGSMVDALRAQMESREIQTQIDILQRKRQSIAVEFNKHLNRADEDTVLITAIDEEIELQTKSALIDSILQGNDQLQSLQQMQGVSEKQAALAKKEGAPNFGLGLNYIVVDKRDDVNIPDNGKDAFLPMVSVSLPIYRSKYKAQIREAKLNRDSYQKKEEEKRNMLETELEKALYGYYDASSRLALNRRQFETAEQALEILMQSYASDGEDFEEILRMQRTLLKYQLEKEKALADMKIAEARIQSLY